MRTHTALVLASLFFLGCHGSSPTGPNEVALALETILSSSHSGFTAPRRQVIRSHGEWAVAWETLHADTTPGPPVPAIDFEREMVVLAASGARPSGCFQIDITGAAFGSGGRLGIEVTESVPGASCFCSAAITQPVHVVRAERVAAPESFVERLHTIQC